MNRNDRINFAYINNVKTWWPPKTTLAEMGAPTLAPPNHYNYFALAFWTCEKPLAMTSLWENTTKFFGTELGKTHSETQKYIKDLYKNGGKKLIISTFGDSEFPASQGFNPVVCAKKLSTFVKENHADGVDIDFEDS